ncbi:unnamed protein product [marine sediment metagenome]|uniref:HTH cro/C1-type domain-containing protein n=1 Tax=marine sediment metagenome TaxID=412755 RepID=X0W3Z5_9ZZZZ
MREQRVFALLVANYRSENNLTLRQMGDVCDVQFQTITTIENERNGTLWQTVCKVLCGMGMSFADFNSHLQTCEFFREEEPVVKVTVDKVKAKMQLKIHKLEEENALLRFKQQAEAEKAPPVNAFANRYSR